MKQCKITVILLGSTGIPAGSPMNMIFLACDGLFLEQLHMVFSLALYIVMRAFGSQLAGNFTFGRQVNLYNEEQHRLVQPEKTLQQTQTAFDKT